MKNLADLKRAMIAGSKWEAIHFQGNNLGIREIAIVRATQVGFRTNKGSISWVSFPKSKDIKFTKGWVEFWCNWYVNNTLKTQKVALLKYREIK